MKSILIAFWSNILIISLIIGGGLLVFAFDRRPADFPSIHEHLLFLHFDWVAPESLQVSSYEKGYNAGDAARKKACDISLRFYQEAIKKQNKATEYEHYQELQVERKLLIAHNDAILARQKEAWTLAGIDKMHTTGNSCQRAEQIIRGVIK